MAQLEMSWAMLFLTTPKAGHARRSVKSRYEKFATQHHRNCLSRQRSYALLSIASCLFSNGAPSPENHKVPNHDLSSRPDQGPG